MDDHAPESQRPYPPAATGLELRMLQISAAAGILLIAAAIAAMGLGMYALPGHPPNFPQPIFF
ncbi:MAG TPA: hypothetical protein VF334_06890 [Polyangia bacterium]